MCCDFFLSYTEHGPERVSKAAASRKMTIFSGPSSDCHINTECLLNEQSYSNQNTDQFYREQAATEVPMLLIATPGTDEDEGL